MRLLHHVIYLTTILKSSKISGHLLLRDSKDPLVSCNKPDLKSDSWNMKEAVRCAEAEITLVDIFEHKFIHKN